MTSSFSSPSYVILRTSLLRYHIFFLLLCIVQCVLKQRKQVTRRSIEGTFKKIQKKIREGKQTDAFFLTIERHPHKKVWFRH